LLIQTSFLLFVGRGCLGGSKKRRGGREKNSQHETAESARTTEWKRTMQFGVTSRSQTDLLEDELHRKLNLPCRGGRGDFHKCIAVDIGRPRASDLGGRPGSPA